MGNCNSCPSKGNCNKQVNCTIENNENNKIKKIIGVMSGKGGVGKSTVTTLIAKKLNKLGYKVGILDADITGPSIPRLMGLQNERAHSANGVEIAPVVSKEGIKTMSINYMVSDESQPVVWKGPIVSKTVKQFYKDVLWEELDYLLIDMPPGTGDVAISVMQSIPINGLVMVTVPQDMISMIVAKAVNMAKMMQVEVLGIVENMSYIKCPDCGKEIRIFDTEEVDNTLENINLLAKLPMTREVIEFTHKQSHEISEELDSILENLVEKIK